MLVAFDFDGTLSTDEMVVLLGKRAGQADEITSITRRAMEGELSYAESLRARVALLEGLTESDVTAAFEQVRLRDGADDLLAALARADVRTVVLTGGFGAGVEHALASAGATADRVVANELVIEDGRVTGEVRGPLVEGSKADALRSVAAESGHSLEDTIAVGDGANDIPMLATAGTAIGFQPKPAVIGHCDVVVATMDRLIRVLAAADVIRSGPSAAETDR